MAFELPGLPYADDALEPYIDAETMRLHHGKHHRAYVDKLNAALEGHPDLAALPIKDLLERLNDIPEDIRTTVRNNGGGHANHTIFWANMTPTKNEAPNGELLDALMSTFGSIEAFREKFTAAATSVFGSGWAWLALKDGKLNIVTRPNQDSPYMDNIAPILGLDVWEHAYYLHYQNRRPEYISAWWNVVHWTDAGQRYLEALKA